MLEDDQVAVTPQAGAGVDHAAVGRRYHRVTGFARDVHALVLGLVKTCQHRTLRRPDPGDIVLAARRGGRCRCRRFGGAGARGRRSAAGRCRRERRDRAGRHGPGHGHRTLDRRRHAQDLADFNQVGVFKIAPAPDVAPVLAGVQPDADQGVARLDRVVAGLAGILKTRQLLDARGINRAHRRTPHAGGPAVLDRCAAQAARSAGGQQQDCGGQKTGRQQTASTPSAGVAFRSGGKRHCCHGRSGLFIHCLIHPFCKAACQFCVRDAGRHHERTWVHACSAGS